MRVGIFTESYEPLINGVSTSVDTLIAELESAGHTVFVFTSRIPNHTDERSGVFRFPSINSLVEPEYVLPIPFSPSIWAAIPGLQLDIIHSQSPFFLGILARRVAHIHGIPHISTNHTLYTAYAHYMPFMPPPMTRQCLVRWMRRYYSACDRVLAPSDFTRRRLIQDYRVTAPVTVMPTGIPAAPNLPPARELALAEFGLQPDARIILSVGRVAREKNLSMLVQAFAKIVAASPNGHLIIAGSGNGVPRLRRLVADLNLTRQVIFTGFLGREKLNLLYHAAEVFLFSSTTETQGLVVGEALAAGTPCVVVNEGGAPESIRDNADGFLVPNDPAEMAARALELLNDSALHARMSEQATRHAAEMQPDKIARRIMEIYQELIARGKRM